MRTLGKVVRAVATWNKAVRTVAKWAVGGALFWAGLCAYAATWT